MKQDFDPKLKACIAEIQAVLARYEVGGFISIVSPTHGEFGLEFPTWAAIRVEDVEGQVGLRLRIKKDQVELASRTVHFIHGVGETCLNAARLMDNLMTEMKNAGMQVETKDVDDGHELH